MHHPVWKVVMLWKVFFRIVLVLHLVSFLMEHSRCIFKINYLTFCRCIYIYLILMVVPSPLPFPYLHGGRDGGSAR